MLLAALVDQPHLISGISARRSELHRPVRESQHTQDAVSVRKRHSQLRAEDIWGSSNSSHLRVTKPAEAEKTVSRAFVIFDVLSQLGKEGELIWI